MTPKEEKLLADAQAAAEEQIERNGGKPTLPAEIDVDKLHAFGNVKHRREITPEMMKMAAARQSRARAEWRKQQKLRAIHDRLYILARDCGPRLMNPFTPDDPDSLRQSEYEVYHKDQKLVLADIQEFIDNIAEHVTFGDGLILFGPPGTGKDHLCVKVARQAIIELDDCDARWLDGKAFNVIALDMVRGGADRMREFQTCRVLVFSDPVVPGTTLSPHQFDAMWRLLNERWLHKRPTFVTSNCKTVKDLESAIGSALLDRLKQGKSLDRRMLMCNWPSFRGRG